MVRASLVSVKQARIHGVDRLSGHSNYILGNDPGRWQVGIPQFGKVRYEGSRDGTSFVYSTFLGGF